MLQKILLISNWSIVLANSWGFYERYTKGNESVINNDTNDRIILNYSDLNLDIIG